MSTEEPKVYVTQEQPRISYEMAEDYGEVIFVSLHDLPTVSSSLRAKKAIADIKENMKHYRPGIDFILPSGSPLNIASVMMIAGRMGDVHNILKWDNRMQRYSKVRLEVTGNGK